MASIKTDEWRVNYKDLKICCRVALDFEIVRRTNEGEPLMNKGDILICETCGTEMICEIGESKKLRWGLKRDVG